MTRVAVIYSSATGNVFALAQAVAEGATEARAEVRLRKVREINSPEAIAQNAKWAAHREATADIAEAELADLEWADAFIFGSPTRFGNITGSLKHFLDQTGGLWSQGKLTNKVVSGFTSASTAHGGLESTLLALYNTFYSWGAIIVPPGYADPIQFKAGNPYGASHVGSAAPGEISLAAAHFQGRRVAEITSRVIA